MSTFKFVNEKALSRDQLVARIVQLYKKDPSSNNKLLYKLQKQLRLKDKVSDQDSYAYYRQLDEWLSQQ